jgi:ATP-dependent Clp protease protease subunit
MKQFKPTYSISAKSATEVEILIYGVIGDGWGDSNPGKKFVKDFKELEAKYDRINVRINSPGGSVHDGLPMFNTIRASKKDVHTYIDGIAYSMGAMIAISGKTVHAAKGSLFLLHNVSGYAGGNARDMRRTAEEMDIYDEVLGQLIADKSGKTLAQVNKEWMNYDDHLMTATKAKDNGFVDVVEDYATQPMPDGVEDLSFDQVMAYYQPENNKQPADRQNYVARQMRKILKLKNKQEKNMGIFGTDYPVLNALVGKAAGGTTAEDIQAVNAELKGKNIDIIVIGVTDLAEANANADAVTNGLTALNAVLGAGNTKPTLAEAINAVIAASTATAGKVVTLTAEVTEANKLVAKFGNQPGAVPTPAAPAAPAAGEPVAEEGVPLTPPAAPAMRSSFDVELDEIEAKKANKKSFIKI